MLLKPWLLILAASGLLATAGAHAAPQYFPHAVPADARSLPFSDAVRVGETLYVAGHLGLDPRSGRAPADSAVEARLALDAVQATLKAAGMTMEDLVSVTVYCTDLALYDNFNSVYASYFHGKYPARAMIGAASLLRGGHFEVQGIAVKAAPSPH